MRSPASSWQAPTRHDAAVTALRVAPGDLSEGGSVLMDLDLSGNACLAAGLRATGPRSDDRSVYRCWTAPHILGGGTMNWRELFELRFRPTADLGAVAASWLLVVGSLAVATFIVTPARGVAYFLVYAVIGAAGFGVTLPTWWTVWRRRRTIADLGVSTRRIGISLAIQAVLGVGLYFLTLARVTLPPTSSLLPLMALALCIGLFEAIFWRGWVQSRLECIFGFIPALLLGSAAYALYHIGYGMGWGEIGFLFFIGLLYGATFRITGSIFILWPLFQPIGQLTTLINDGLSLSPLAALGFVEALIAMVIVLFVAFRYAVKRDSVSVFRKGTDHAASALDSSEAASER